MIQAEIGAEAKDLKRDTSRKSLGEWMAQYGKEMEALQPSPDKQPVGDKPPKKASLSGISNQAANPKKSKQAPSKGNKGAPEAKSPGRARTTRMATREVAGGGGKEGQAKAAGTGKVGKKGKEAAGAEALVELKSGKPSQAKGKGAGLAEGGKRKAGEGKSPGVKREKKAKVAAEGATPARKEAKPGKKATDEDLQQPAMVSCLPRYPRLLDIAIHATRGETVSLKKNMEQWDCVVMPGWIGGLAASCVQYSNVQISCGAERQERSYLSSTADTHALLQLGGLPNLTSKQFLGLSKESQKTYTMSHALLAGLAMIAKSEQPT